MESNGVKFRLALEDRIWNYYIGCYDIYKDINHPFMKDITNAFKDQLNEKQLEDILQSAITLYKAKY